ncbi:MAG: hypothetical protein ABEL51_12225 [Salinibacter sp.]
MSWDDPMGRGINQTATIRSGTFVQIALTSKQLVTIGGAKEVSGTVAGGRFSISHDARAPIRRLLSRIEKTEADSSAEGQSKSDDLR